MADTNKILKTRIVLKNDTAENWENSTGKVLLKGEIGIEIDTRKFKIGDGTSDWQTCQLKKLKHYLMKMQFLFMKKNIMVQQMV